MEVKESSFIIDNNGSLISQLQWIQYDSANEWKKKVCQADTYLPNATAAALFVKMFE